MVIIPTVQSLSFSPCRNLKTIKTQNPLQILMHLAGWDHSTTPLGYYCIFTCLLSIFPSNFSSNEIYSTLPHCWGVTIWYSQTKAVTTYWHGLCPTYFFSVLIFPQCPGYLTQTRSSQPRRSVGNSFQSLFTLIHLLVRFLTGHKTLLFPSQGKSGTYWSLVAGNIKDWNHQKCFFLISPFLPQNTSFSWLACQKPDRPVPSPVGILSVKSLKVGDIQRLIVAKIMGAQSLSAFDLSVGNVRGLFTVSRKSECQKAVIPFLLLELLWLELSSKFKCLEFGGQKPSMPLFYKSFSEVHGHEVPVWLWPCTAPVLKRFF